MVTPLTWASYLDLIGRLAVVKVSDPNFLAMAPQMVNYAELRIMRDVDFLSTVGTVPGFSLVAHKRLMAIPIGTVVTLQEILVLPVGVTDPDAGTIKALYPTTKEYINAVFNSVAGARIPDCFALVGEGQVALGPWPDQNYPVQLVGTIRPPSLSPTNTSSFIASYLPDLLTMASMVWLSGYQRNYGRQSDDPQMAVSYEQQYQALLKGAMIEEARKKFQAAGWTSMSPAVIASTSRNIGEMIAAGPARASG